METILTVLITLGVVSLIGTVVGVMRLNRRVDDLEVARMDIDDDIIRLRKELEEDIEHLHRETNRQNDNNSRNSAIQSSNLDRRLDNVWTEIHKLDKTINPNKELIK
jgi:predicted RNase H-like nuclease (RuvC/YqgF family)